VELNTDQTAARSKSSPKVRLTAMKTILTSSACIAGLLMIAGCAGKVRYPRYYTLDIAPVPKPALENARLPAGVAVRRFETPAYLRQGRIVYREAPEAVDFYEYHRWAAEPGPTVTTAMIDSIRSARLFSFVRPYDSLDKPDYLVTGRLERLDEIDYGGTVRVETKLSAELVGLRTGTTIWTGTATTTSNVETSNVNSVVAAMGRAVQMNIDRLVAEMEMQLTNGEVASRTSP
jgi:ABC-type uncharacterized transport system auxiliary subunit